MKALINELSQVPAPSGHESRMRDALRKELKSMGASAEVDALGNLIVKKGKKSAAGLKIMLSSHMDEVGLIATHIDASGFVRFSAIGPLPTSILIGSRVVFLNGARGVIFCEPQEDRNKVPAIDQLFIDVGASKPGDCPVQVGDLAVFDAATLEIGSTLVGKALSSRAGCAILLETLRQVKETPHELSFVFVCQHEVGNRGVQAAAYAIDPDLGIALDVTDVGDTPSAAKMAVSLGKGPAVKIRDAGMLSDPRVIRWMNAAAEKTSIPCQKEIMVRTTTDASQIQINRAGVPSGALSLPCRYVHTYSEMIDLNDIHHTVTLLVKLLSEPVQLK